jgi:Arc/MetJ family transcription regulator
MDRRIAHQADTWLVAYFYICGAFFSTPDRATVRTVRFFRANGWPLKGPFPPCGDLRPKRPAKIFTSYILLQTPLFRIWVYMRTNIDLDENLVARGLKLSGLRTKRELVNLALSEFVRHKDQKKILELRGKILWQGDLAALRQSRF